MPLFHNPNRYPLYLAGPDGRTTTIAAGVRVELPEYFRRYCDRRGMLRAVDRTATACYRPAGIQEDEIRRRQLLREARRIAPVNRPTPVVVGAGRTTHVRGEIELILRRAKFPISNGIGVGILSYNRLGSLTRLVNSIIKYTDLRRTTVFIADDGSTDPNLLKYLTQLRSEHNFIVLQGDSTLGVAGNTNRLLRCLRRFDHLLLLNDDVEVLGPGWETYYPRLAGKAGLWQMTHHQPGVYGAQTPLSSTIGGQKVAVTPDRPQGAVLYCSGLYLDTVGYFDERYGRYGMEHVDWSCRAADFDLQPPGHFDGPDSGRYFRVHADRSAVEERQVHLDRSRELFQSRVPERCQPSPESAVPVLTYVVPFRDIGRSDAIAVVASNIKAQRFPAIELVFVEQDVQQRIDRSFLTRCTLLHAPALQEPFNKSLAFNVGVHAATSPLVILHDADTLTDAGYTDRIWNILKEYQGCHLGARMLYADQESTKEICRTKVVGGDSNCERAVTYFEGGSLACHTSTYWEVGGFNEDFWGYGCEDCDFYYRLSQGCRFQSNRVVDFLHLWHGRVSGWEKHHEVNKVLEQRMKALPFQEYLRQLWTSHRQYGG